MTPSFRLWASLAAVLGLLSGCANIGGASMVDMAVRHNQTVDQIERNTLLLNLLRAADEQLLTFTTVGFVSGNGSVSSNANLSDSRRSFLGSMFSFGTGVGVSASSGFSYTLSSLDNEQFNRSFLADIPLDRLYFLLAGTGLSRSVVFTLVVDGFELDDVQAGAQAPSRRYNNQLDPGEWGPFQEVVARHLRLGLSMEDVPEETPVGPRLTRDEALYQIGSVISAWNPSSWSPTLPGAARPKLVEVPGSDQGEGAKTHQLVMSGSKARFCFNPPRIQDWPYDGEALCRTTGAQRNWLRLRATRQGGEASAKPLPVNLQGITMRSPREAFYFVGQLVRAQVDGMPNSQPHLVESADAGRRAARPLIRVICEAPAKGVETLAVATHRGKTCHIPLRDDSHSADVIRTLSLLVTLSKVTGTVPASPAVLIQ